MIHYHGGPITPTSVAERLWSGKHGFVSFENPSQLPLVAEVCQSFALDNGAFTAWSTGKELDVRGYVQWVNAWCRHPGFDFALIPDVIDGSVQDNDIMLCRFRDAGGDLLRSVPVWHMHEPFDRLKWLCHAYQRVALGSSGEWSTVGTAGWWQRMADAMDAICDSNGQPPCKLHGLRMLNTEVFRYLPLSSADSTNVARNHARERKTYALTEGMAALVMASRIEQMNSAPAWLRRFSVQYDMGIEQ